jgi:hypothetical protein
MNPPVDKKTTRRSFLSTTGKITAASALAGVKIPFVHAAEDNTMQVALIGCGGRGTGAADNALSVTGPPINLVAMVDVFQNKLNGSYNALKSKHGDRVDRARRPQIHRLRRVQARDGLHEARQHRDLHDAARISLGALSPYCHSRRAATSSWKSRVHR